MRFVVIAMALLLQLEMVSAAAQETAGSSPVANDVADAKARKLFNEGSVAYEAGEFEKALDKFRKSYELSKRPALLFNIGTAADRLRKNEMAYRYLSEYREKVPNAKNAENVDRRIELLRKEIEEDKERERLQREELERLERSSKLLPTLLISLGVVAVATGAVLFGVAISNKNTIDGFVEGEMPMWIDHQAKADRIPVFSTIGLIAMGVGAFTAGLGAVLLATSGSKKTSKVALSFTGTGFSLGGRF